MQANEAIAQIVSDPAWLAHRYDPGHDAVHFVRADRAARARAPFLTDEELKPDAPLVLRREEMAAASPVSARVHFVFHSAYCCSTLLCRALDLPGTTSTLKEPQILNDLVGWRHRGGDAARVGIVLDSALRLLARPFESGEAVIVKPSNLVNGVADAILKLRPGAKAVLMYAPLPGFLASIARKGMWGRLWVRELLAKQLRDGIVDLGFEPDDYFRLTDLQVAAVGWLAQQALFSGLCARYPDRIRLLNGDDFAKAPRVALPALARHFELRLTDADVTGIVANEFSRDAKYGATFAQGARSDDRRGAEMLHADELSKVAAWAKAVATNAGVEVEPASSLHLR